MVDGHTALGRDRGTIEALLSGPEGTDCAWGGWHATAPPAARALTRVMIPPETVFPRRIGSGGDPVTGFSQTTDQPCDPGAA